MSFELHVERDDRGWRRARVPEPFRALSEFLESDLQNSVRCCDEVLRFVEAIVSRSRESWQRSGNATTLTITLDQALIEHDYFPEIRCTLSLLDFQEAVRRWREFIQNETHAA